MIIEPSGIVKLNLSAQDKEKLQTGSININIYEGGLDKPSGKLTIDLLDKKPQYQFSAYLNDTFGEIKGERLGEIKSISINEKPVNVETVITQDNKSVRANVLKFAAPLSTATANVVIELAAGDVINQTVKLFPPRPNIIGEVGCQSNENQSRLIISKKAAYKSYELKDCIYPSDTDEIKLILIADKDEYNYSTVNKPNVSIGFAKGNSSDLKINNPIAVPAQVMSPQRLDIIIKLDQKIKEQLEDGNQMLVKINDPVRGESNWYAVKAKFLKLPANLAFKCAADANDSLITNESRKNPVNIDAKTAAQSSTDSAPPVNAIADNPVPVNQSCELSGNLSMIESISVSKNSEPEIWQTVGLTSDKITFSKLSAQDYFYIKLRGYAPKIKVNLADLQNVPSAPAPTK